MDRVTDALVRHLLDAGIDGHGKLDSAEAAADRLVRSTGGVDPAVARLASRHTRLAASGGFVTSLGGFLALPVALPANLLGFYVLATRMVAAIAAARGYDLAQDQVRTSVLLTLAGGDARQLLAKVGVVAGPGELTALAVHRLPQEALMVINKGVAFRIVIRLGQHSLGRFGRAVPLVGGVVGGTVDAVLMRRIAAHAREQFPDVRGS